MKSKALKWTGITIAVRVLTATLASVASIEVSGLSVGTHKLIAAYDGNSIFAPTSSVSWSVKVPK